VWQKDGSVHLFGGAFLGIANALAEASVLRGGGKRQWLETVVTRLLPPPNKLPKGNPWPLLASWLRGRTDPPGRVRTGGSIRGGSYGGPCGNFARGLAEHGIWGSGWGGGRRAGSYPRQW
jgi:hypothetical protein